MADVIDLPDPPYLPDTKDKGWRFEIDLQQVQQSDTWALASAETRPWLLMLWVASWQQVPCGSLPSDDRVIAARIGMTSDAFMASKNVLMRGWWMASDRRLYHPTITERVIAMLDRKKAERDRQADYRAKMKSRKNAGSTTESVAPESTVKTSSSDVVTRDKQATDTLVPCEYNTGTGTGTGTSTSSKPNTLKPLSGQPDDGAQESGADGEQDEPRQAGLPGMDAPTEPAEPKPDVEAELIAYLNEKAGREFEPVEANRKLLRARLAEGATPEKIRAVIDAKVTQWADDPKMAQYLQPATLFNATKFAQYVGALGARMPTLTPMRAPRAEKFDPLAYVSQTNVNAHTETGHERHAGCIDVHFQEVAR
jgi:uncharacterized phage protein (TIGR02220 family)